MEMYGKGLRHLSVTADTTKYNVGYLSLTSTQQVMITQPIISELQ